VYKAILYNGQPIAMEKLGWGKWRVMHYMIMDSKLKYNDTQNYNLKYILLLHKANVNVGNV
jgi:hypothetical protein